MNLAQLKRDLTVTGEAKPSDSKRKYNRQGNNAVYEYQQMTTDDELIKTHHAANLLRDGALLEDGRVAAYRGIVAVTSGRRQTMYGYKWKKVLIGIKPKKRGEL